MQRSPLNTTFDFQTVRTATSPHATKQRYRRAPHGRGALNAHTHLHPRAVSSHLLRGAEARPVIREAGCGKSALCCRYPTKAEVFPLAWDRWLSLRHQAVRTMLDRAIARGSGYAKDGPAEVRHAQSYPLFLADSPGMTRPAVSTLLADKPDVAHHRISRQETPGKISLTGGSNVIQLAEPGGFEPPVEFNPDPSLAVKSVRPLRHVSASHLRVRPRAREIDVLTHREWPRNPLR